MKYTYRYLFTLVAITFCSACKNEVPDDTTISTEVDPLGIRIDQNQFSSSKFELGKVELQSFSKTLNATGSLHVPERSTATVSTLMSGTVGRIQLSEGQWVNKGQTLFSVTNPELINLQEDYLVASSQLDYLSEEYNRQIDLSKENLSTKKDLLKAKSELTTTEARHGALRKRLDLYGVNAENLSTSNLISSLEVVAPISGYVSDIKVRQGMYIEPNQSALSISNTSQIYLKLSVLERDVLLLEKGQNLTFTLQSDPSKTRTATVYIINKSIDDKGLISVNCRIDGDVKKLVAGMYANARIVLDEYESLSLPETALVKIGDAYYALALQKKEEEVMTYDKVRMKTGEVQNGYVELINPSSPEAEYLIKGAYFLVQ